MYTCPAETYVGLFSCSYVHFFVLQPETRMHPMVRCMQHDAVMVMQSAENVVDEMFQFLPWVCGVTDACVV